MADSDADRTALLKNEYLGQTARIPWRDLQTYFAQGSVVEVGAQLDLVGVAVQLGLDNTEQFKQWIDSGEVQAVSDSRARTWLDDDISVWAVVAAPWVLVQNREGDLPGSG
ncbi:MAG: DUF2288 domain-containing protein [Halioglobus sp.]